ncbi:MAG: DUF554 domain-containing protein [Proteobacteria bacterium]|nr:DUF554 domain-containing protein [Pseudomonadota bacterium]
MKGYLVNTVTVMLGSFAGIYFGKKIKDEVTEKVFNVLGFITIFLGIKMTLTGKDIIIIVLSLVIGTLAGSLIDLEVKVSSSLEKLKRSFKKEGKIEGFLIASVLFCVGSMTIIGSIKDGLYNDATLIKIKSVMDGFASFVLSSRYGIPVAFSSLTVLVVQGTITISSGYLAGLSQSFISNLDGVGGIIVLSLGFNLLKIKNIKTLDMLPSLVFLPIFSLWLD